MITISDAAQQHFVKLLEFVFDRIFHPLEKIYRICYHFRFKERKSRKFFP